MSWTDYYPVFEDSLVDEYVRDATDADRAELEEWCGIARRINERPSTHRVVVSLFWKNLITEEGELGGVTRERMKNAEKLGLISRYARGNIM